MGVDATKVHGAACEVVERSLGMPDRSITAMFERIKDNTTGKSGKVVYSHKQHTKTEVQYACISLPTYTLIKLTIISAEFVRWVAESMCPFKTVTD
jgi:hypothetical protein